MAPGCRRVNLARRDPHGLCRSLLPFQPEKYHRAHWRRKEAFTQEGAPSLPGEIP